MENRELTIDDLASPVGEDMQSEVQPAMSYFAEGGEVEQAMFNQPIPARPTAQMPQQRLKRTAAEMLQRVSPMPMGTMRFSPLNMPGVAGRQIQQFAEGGEVDGMSSEERALIANQMNAGAPAGNLFGANLTAPGPAPLPSFETNVPTFNPTYTPPTGPLGVTGLTESQLQNFPTQLGTAAPALTFAGTQQVTPGTARSLYEQITPSTLAAAPYDFSKIAASYTPTEQTFTKPTLISEEQARLKQPVLTRYEPDIRYGGLQTYLGELQTSPYKDSGTTTDTPTGVTDWRSYGFTAPASGSAVSPEPTFWFNRNLGVGIMAPSGGFVPPSADWQIGGFNVPEEDTTTGGVGNDTVTGGAGNDQIDFTDATRFTTGEFTAPADRPKVSNLQDVFMQYAGSDLNPALVKNFQNATFGWDRANKTFTATPQAVSKILASQAFKTTATKTINNLLGELGYSVGGKKTTGTNISTADRNNYVSMLTSGNADIFRVANLITSPLRMAGALNVSAQTTPTLSRIYTNAGVIPAAGGATTGGATTGGTAPASTGSFTQEVSEALRPSTRSTLSDLRKSVKGLFSGRRRAEGSPPEGEYADPVEALMERQRARRELGVMDQGSARDRLKKFLGGEDLAPRGYKKGGEVTMPTGPVTRYEAERLAKKLKLNPKDYGAEAMTLSGAWTHQGLADALGVNIVRPPSRSVYQKDPLLATPTAMKPAPTADDVLKSASEFGDTAYQITSSPYTHSTRKGQDLFVSQTQPQKLAQLQAQAQSLGLTLEQLDQAYGTGQQKAQQRDADWSVKKKQLDSWEPPTWFKIASALAGGQMGLQSLAANPSSISSLSGLGELGKAVKVGSAAWSAYKSPEALATNKIAQTNFPRFFAEGGAVKRAEGLPVTAEGYELEPTFGQRMGANVSDFLMNVGIKGADLLPADKSKMSAAHKLYLDTFGIKENRAPVTKDYFNQEEMDALADLISRKGGKKGSMSYKDYDKLLEGKPITEYPLISGRLDPYVSIAKSLGQFNYEYDPKTNRYRIVDEYDFNPLTAKSGIRSDSGFVGDYISEDDTLMDKLRVYAGRKLPPGTGRKVDLSVPAPKKTKNSK